jgi:hypothetical protein
MRWGSIGVLGALAVGVVMALLSGCGMFGGNLASYRFRMTVEVATVQGMKSGSSVMEGFASRIVVVDPRNLRGSGGLKGEAVVVDLSDGPVFVLLKVPVAGDGLDNVEKRALSPQMQRGNFEAYLDAVTRLGGWFNSAKAELPRKDWPMMVRLRDLRDPKSVERVDPDAIGVKRIMLETTGDVVTTGIEKRLGWLPNQNGSFVRRLSVPDPTNPPIAAILNKRDFSTEIK